MCSPHVAQGKKSTLQYFDLNEAGLPAEYSQSVIDIFADDREELPPYRVFLHFLVVTSFGNESQPRLKLQIFPPGLCSPAKGSVGMFDSVMLRAVFLKER